MAMIDDDDDEWMIDEVDRGEGRKKKKGTEIRLTRVLRYETGRRGADDANQNKIFDRRILRATANVTAIFGRSYYLQP